MAKRLNKRPEKPAAANTGAADELHQTAGEGRPVLTTNQGIPVSDNQNSLRIGERGPTLLEDFVLREKIMHFDHERIPERIVHARGAGAHGYFEVYKSLAKYTKADFLQRPKEKTRVFVRFSTVAGGAGSVDLPRDVRGFAVKFYTNEGNFDLVGNNIPVFFIQDAMKFPDLVHSVKMEPDRGFPQAASAHDTFWDFVSLMPESMHMIMWAMSDRAIPRSFRTIEGFGVHTFRLVNADGESTFVKFHWRPKLGLQSVLWDEAVKISGADPDFHRRDLWQAIDAGDYPEWELGLQIFSEEDADKFDFDVLDATKLIPEEIVPLQMVGRLVLDRNPDNFFAETEQVAYCPANIVPGIDFSDDPLLQGRLFSYLDTQLKRLGSPNFHEIPINRPVCPMRNFQRDGHMRMEVAKGRVNYEPNTLGADGPRECPRRGFTTMPREKEGKALRIRAESFADHYSHARLFYRSQTPPEQNHMVSALVFELSKVETPAIRERIVSHLQHVDPELAKRVAKGLRLAEMPKPAETAVPPRDMDESPALSIIAKTEPTLMGRVIGCLVTDGVDAGIVQALRTAAKSEGAMLKIIAPMIGGVTTANAEMLKADMQLAGAPSVFFDAVVIAASRQGAEQLLGEAAARDFVSDAFAHLKVIGYVDDALPLLRAAGIDENRQDSGVMRLDKGKKPADFIAAARKHRIWDREPLVRLIP
jgi:catalase